jgi:hypothetical protein
MDVRREKMMLDGLVSTHCFTSINDANNKVLCHWLQEELIQSRLVFFNILGEMSNIKSSTPKQLTMPGL